MENIQQQNQEPNASGTQPNVEELQKSFQQEKQQWDLQRQDYEAKLQMNPFANPVVEKINEFYKQGVDHRTIQNYMKVQFSDLNAMSPVELVKHRLMFEKPEFSEEDIRFYIEDEYGKAPSLDDFEDDENAEKKLKEATDRYNSKLRRAGLEAKEFLSNQTVAIDKGMQEKQSQQAALRERYTKGIETIAKSVLNQDVDFTHKPITDILKKGDSYVFDSFKPEITDEIRKEALQTMKEYALAKKMPIDETTAAELSQVYKQYVFLRNFEAYRESLIRDLSATLKQAFLEENSIPANTGGRRKMVFPPL